MTTTNQTPKLEGLKIVRKFKAPKSLVFAAFSTAEAFAEWWGPAGMPITVVEFEFTQGGKLHYKMEGNGQTMWGVFKYHNIMSPDLIEFVNSFSDEAGNICRPPFPMEFPYEIYNQLTFQENAGITTLTLSSHPINATAEQEAIFNSMNSNMSQGFEGTFNQLEAYLSKIQQLS